MAIEPVTREERFLAAAGGRSVTTPEPITRKEQLLQGIIDAVKSGGATPDVIEGAVNDYLNANPVKPGATTEQATQIEQNKNDIADLQTEVDELKESGGNGSGQNPANADVVSIKTVLGNMMTIIKAQVEDEVGTPQGYNMDVSGLVAQSEALIAALGSSGDTGGGDSGGDTTEKTLTGISAVYSGGSVPVGTAVSALTGVAVTATYDDGSTAAVTGYTLTGTIAEGENTVTVTYQGMTTTFAVTGVAESGGEGGNSVSTLSLCTNAGYISTDGVTVKTLANAFYSDDLDASNILSAKTKYRTAFVTGGYMPFLFYAEDGTFLSGVAGTATEAGNTQYNHYEITESDIPADAKHMKIVYIYPQGATNLDSLTTVYK